MNKRIAGGRGNGFLLFHQQVRFTLYSHDRSLKQQIIHQRGPNHLEFPLKRSHLLLPMVNTSLEKPQNGEPSTRVELVGETNLESVLYNDLAESTNLVSATMSINMFKYFACCLGWSSGFFLVIIISRS